MTDLLLFFSLVAVFGLGIFVGAVFTLEREIRWHQDRRRGFVRIPVNRR